MLCGGRKHTGRWPREASPGGNIVLGAGRFETRSAAQRRPRRQEAEEIAIRPPSQGRSRFGCGCSRERFWRMHRPKLGNCKILRQKGTGARPCGSSREMPAKLPVRGNLAVAIGPRRHPAGGLRMQNCQLAAARADRSPPPRRQGGTLCREGSESENFTVVLPAGAGKSVSN